MLSKKAPVKKINVSGNKVDLSKTARKRASSFTSAGAARGLKQSKKGGKEAIDKDYESLEKVEGMYVPPKKAKKYIPVGKN